MINNVIFLETTQSWPVKFTANNSKVELLAKGLLLNGDCICIINSTAGEVGKHGAINDIKGRIRYFSFKRIFNSKILSRCINLVGLYQILKREKKLEFKNVIVMGGPYYIFFLLIVLIARLNGYKITITLTEWAIGIKDIKGIKKFDSFLYNYTFGYFVDGILPISTYLENQVSHFSKRVLKVPVLADYDIKQNSSVHVTRKSNYFLYCGSVDYKKPINLILQAFKELKACKNDIKLVLIISGSEFLIDKIEQEIRILNLSDSVSIFNQLPYNELFRYYQNALALLVPLENITQDKARFSQKIAEYLSATRPIITCAVGEINEYFKDEKTAFIGSNFDVNTIFNQMKKVLNNPELANEVGIAGRKLGEENFDFKVNGRRIHQFFCDL